MNIEEYYVQSFMEAQKANASNAGTVFVNDYAHVKEMSSESLDTIILERVLNREYDYEKIIIECKRVLKKGGKIVAVLASMAPSFDESERLWGFTIASAHYIFEKYFPVDNVKISSYGNALAGRLLLSGILVEHVIKKDLETSDPIFPVIVGVEAIKE